MAQHILEARGIHKHFGALHVLKGVDLLVAERELVFVIGPSGSGKSTLLRCLNRLEEPSSGSVVVDGIDMLSPRTDINHARQRIGMVFQSFNLSPHMSALGNVTLALRNQMQDVLDCMKKDGTIVKLSEKWFGRVPPPDALERVITPGYGVPGMPGYDPTPHELKCG